MGVVVYLVSRVVLPLGVLFARLCVVSVCMPHPVVAKGLAAEGPAATAALSPNNSGRAKRCVLGASHMLSQWPVQIVYGAHGRPRRVSTLLYARRVRCRGSD